MTERMAEMQKTALAAIGFSCFIILCFLTVLNTYRMALLDDEVHKLRKLVSKCEPSRILVKENQFEAEQYISRSRRNILNQSFGNDDNYPNQKYTGSKIPSNSEPFSASPWNAILPNRKHGVARSSSSIRKPAIRSLDTNSDVSEDYNGSSESELTTAERSIQRSRSRFGRIKPLPSIHLSGDTSSYVLGTHENFNGNGHLKHLQRIFVDWKVSSWAETLGMMNHFVFDEGYLTIKERGLYLVYAQIYYLDEHDTNGYRVFKNDNMVLQCTVSLHGGNGVQKGNTCYTAGVEYFADGDKLSLGDILHGHYSLFEPGKSFFGVVKLGDFRTRI